VSREFTLVDSDGRGVCDVELAGDAVDVSDGFHTFTDLYDHRRALTAVMAAYAATMPTAAAWRSKAHHPEDEPMFEGGYFVVGIQLDTGPITYHYKLEHWDDFAAVPELQHAPRWDGAMPEDTVTRLLDLAHLMARVPPVPEAPAVVDPAGDPYRDRPQAWTEPYPTTAPQVQVGDSGWAGEPL
jgi:hypothetical protein